MDVSGAVRMTRRFFMRTPGSCHPQSGFAIRRQHRAPPTPGTSVWGTSVWGQAPFVLRIGDRHRLVFQLVLNTCRDQSFANKASIRKNADILIYVKKSLQCKSKLVGFEQNSHVADGIRWLFYSQVSSSMTPKVAVPVQVGIPLWLEKLVKNRLIRPYHK